MEPAAIRSTALITGASGGIGLALARQFARAGYQLVLVARDAARLDEQALALAMEVSVPITAIAKDLCRAGACAALAAELEARDLTVTVLVNNAGVGIYGAFGDSDPAAVEALIALNITALTTLTRLLLPGMRARRHGRILNVASTAAFQPGPLMAVYFASKAYVLSFSEAIAAELADSGVTVTCLCPGPTATGFAARARMGASRLFQRGVMDSEQVAATGFRACIAGRRLVVPGVINNLHVAAVRLSPRWLVTRVVRALLAQSAG
jgi:short-subunit dehydrogenase